MVHNRLYMEPARTLTILEAHRTHKCTLLCAIDILWHSVVGLQTLCKQTKYLQSYKWRMLLAIYYTGNPVSASTTASRNVSWIASSHDVYLSTCLLACLHPALHFRTARPLKQGMESLQTCVKLTAALLALSLAHTHNSSSEGECCVGYHSCYRCGKTWPRGKRGDPYAWIPLKFILSCINLTPERLFSFDSCPLLKRVLVYC